MNGLHKYATPVHRNPCGQVVFCVYLATLFKCSLQLGWRPTSLNSTHMYATTHRVVRALIALLGCLVLRWRLRLLVALFGGDFAAAQLEPCSHSIIHSSIHSVFIPHSCNFHSTFIRQSFHFHATFIQHLFQIHSTFMQRSLQINSKFTP